MSRHQLILFVDYEAEATPEEVLGALLGRLALVRPDWFEFSADEARLRPELAARLARATRAS